MHTRDLKNASDLLVEASELLARSGHERIAAEVRTLVERIDLSIPKSPSLRPINLPPRPLTPTIR